MKNIIITILLFLSSAAFAVAQAPCSEKGQTLSNDGVTCKDSTSRSLGHDYGWVLVVFVVIVVIGLFAGPPIWRAIGGKSEKVGR